MVEPFEDRERIKMISPHTDFDSYLVVGDDGQLTVQHVSTKPPEPESASSTPPTPVWNETTGHWELPAAATLSETGETEDWGPPP